jgi:heme/copper-type cytochrome/quinol oxidase subunit 3
MIDIPYTVDRRPDTGINNVVLGTWLFLASEVMLFGGLFSAYILLRSGAAAWPDGASVSSVPLGMLNTALLLASSLAITLSRRAAAGGKERRSRVLLGVTAVLAAGFLAVKGIEYAAKLEAGLYPATSTFMAVYYLLTSVHGLHVLGGLLVIAYFATAGTWSTGGSLPRFANRLASLTLYWHFVDVVWICLFVMLYLL